MWSLKFLYRAVTHNGQVESQKYKYLYCHAQYDRSMTLTKLSISPTVVYTNYLRQYWSSPHEIHVDIQANIRCKYYPRDVTLMFYMSYMRVRVRSVLKIYLKKRTVFI